MSNENKYKSIHQNPMSKQNKQKSNVNNPMRKPNNPMSKVNNLMSNYKKFERGFQNTNTNTLVSLRKSNTPQGLPISLYSCPILPCQTIKIPTLN